MRHPQKPIGFEHLSHEELAQHRRDNLKQQRDERERFKRTYGDVFAAAPPRPFGDDAHLATSATTVVYQMRIADLVTTISVDEAATLLGLTSRRVRALARSGLLRPVWLSNGRDRLPSPLRFAMTEMLRFIDPAMAYLLGNSDARRVQEQQARSKGRK